MCLLLALAPLLLCAGATRDPAGAGDSRPQRCAARREGQGTGGACAAEGDAGAADEASLLALAGRAGAARSAVGRGEGQEVQRHGRPGGPAGAAEGWVQFPPGAQVTELPGLSSLPGASIRMSSGYVPVTGDGSRQLFYWYVESQGKPSTDPLLLWTNGGPGCSGLLGFMTEMGPFRATSGLALALNPDAWTKFANMVFIEQPAGVGFSPHANSSIEFTDAMVAEDNWEFIKGFLALYPQLKALPFYLTSESYGGHYLPTLSREILRKNTGQVNFKGFVVGNPLIYLGYTNLAMYAVWHGWSLLPQPLYDQFLTNKCWLLDDERMPLKPMPRDTLALCNLIMDELGELTAGLDPYALGLPTCASAQVLKILNRVARRFLPRLSARRSYEPCSEDYATAYLNKPDVQKALHIKGSIAWSGCADLPYSSQSINENMVPVIKELVEHGGLKIMIMSGNMDSVCAPVGDQEWLWDTGFINTEPWSPYKLQNQVAGFTANFTAPNGFGFRYATVQGAGHMIPSTQPKRGAYIMQNFLFGEW